MTVLGITRRGTGDIWLFESASEAWRSPLVDPGDAVLTDDGDIFEQYSVADMRELADLTENDGFVQTLMECLTKPWGSTRLAMQATREKYGAELFSRLAAKGRAVPTHPAQLLELCQRDRDWHLKRNGNMAAKEAAKTAPAAAKAPKPPKEPKAPKVAAEKKIAGHPVTTKIKFGTMTVKDAEGKETTVTCDATKNNPKRAGTKGHADFAKYKNGMTIAAALEAGISAADVGYNLGKGFLVIAA